MLPLCYAVPPVSRNLIDTEENLLILKIAQAGGQTWDLWFSFIFSLNSSALDDSATSPSKTSLALFLVIYPLVIP